MVIDSEYGSLQSSPAGYVQVEMQSIFNTPPTMAVDVTALEANQMQTDEFDDFVGGSIDSGTPLALFVTEVPGGDPTDLTVFIQ